MVRRTVSKIRSWMIIYIAMFAVMAVADENEAPTGPDSRLSPVSLGTESSRLRVEPRVERADI